MWSRIGGEAGDSILDDKTVSQASMPPAWHSRLSMRGTTCMAQVAACRMHSTACTVQVAAHSTHSTACTVQHAMHSTACHAQHSMHGTAYITQLECLKLSASASSFSVSVSFHSVQHQVTGFANHAAKQCVPIHECMYSGQDMYVTSSRIWSQSAAGFAHANTL